MISNQSIFDLIILTVWTIVLVIHSKVESRKKMLYQRIKEIFNYKTVYDKSKTKNDKPIFMTVLSIDSSQTASSTTLPPTIFTAITETNL
jgi:hypothetical protein